MRRIMMFGFVLILAATGTLFAAEDVNPLLIKVKQAKITPLKKEALAWVDAAMPELSKLNDEIWRAAEVAMEEYRSSEVLASYLEGAGFKVERGVAGLPTAFVATYGSRAPALGVLGE